MPERPRVFRRNPEEDILEQILDADVTPKIEHNAATLIESCTYTTTALFAIELYLRREGDDDDGADMLQEFLRKFAEHEAKRL